MQITRDHASRALAQNRDGRMCLSRVADGHAMRDFSRIHRGAPASNAICTSCGRSVIETAATAAAAEFALDFIVAEHDTS